MKMTRKIVYVKEIVDILLNANVVPTQASVLKWVTTQVYGGTAFAGKYGGVKPGDIALYFREFHDKPVD